MYELSVYKTLTVFCFFFYSRHDGDSSVSLLRIFERRAYELRYLFFAYQYLWKCICEMSISFYIFFLKCCLNFSHKKPKKNILTVLFLPWKMFTFQVEILQGWIYHWSYLQHALKLSVCKHLIGSTGFLERTYSQCYNPWKIVSTQRLFIREFAPLSY